MSKYVLKHFETEPRSSLYALYSNEEFYFIVLLINKVLGIRLKRAQKDICFEGSKAFFMAYSHQDKENDYEMFMYNNVHSIYNETNEEEGLLFQESTEFFLLPELGAVDFILKIEGDQSIFAGLIEKIRSIKEVISVFEITEKKLKSKENLIFEY